MRTRLVPALIVVTTLLSLAIAPAQAAGKGGLVTPDLEIKKVESSTYIGGGVIAPDGSGETASRTIRRGHTGSFDVKLPNPGSGTLAATLQGCPPDKGFLVKYFVGSADISKSMKAGTLNVTIGPGSNLTIRVDVIVADTTHVGRVQSCPVNVLQSDTVIDTVIGQATVRS